MSAMLSSTVLEPGQAHEAIMSAGIKKARLPILKIIVLGMLAGVYVGLGAQVYCAVLTDMTANGVVKFFGGVCFSHALMYIVMAGAELFTGNCLLIVAAMAKRIFWWELLKDWFIVYFSNFAGAILLAAIIYGMGVNGYQNQISTTGAILCSTVLKKIHLSHYAAFLRGIGCNFLVCLAILLCIVSKSATGKYFGIIFPIGAFLVMGFEHSIANQYFYSMATMLHCPGFSQERAWQELWLITLGNILGATALAISYWFTTIHGTTNELSDVPYDPSSPHVLHHSKEPAYVSNGNEPASVAHTVNMPKP